MQAIIMAAGFGSRIAEITNGLPKSFLEINKEKLIERAVRLLKERGISDITVVTGYKATEFEKLLGGEVKFVHNPLYFCTNVLGSFACGMHLIDGDFVFIHADTIFDESILDDVIGASDAEITLPVDFKSCVEEEMKVITADGNVTVIHKSIGLDVAEGEFIGVARVCAPVVERLKAAVMEELKEKANHQDYFEAAIQNLIDNGVQVKTVATNGRSWVEIDFPDDYEVAKNLFS